MTCPLFLQFIPSGFIRDFQKQNITRIFFYCLKCEWQVNYLLVFNISFDKMKVFFFYELIWVYPKSVHWYISMLHCVATALAVGSFRGRGCERSELPCLTRDDKKLGRRPWSFLPQSSRWTIIVVYCEYNRVYASCEHTIFYLKSTDGIQS